MEGDFDSKKMGGTPRVGEPIFIEAEGRSLIKIQRDEGLEEGEGGSYSERENHNV